MVKKGILQQTSIPNLSVDELERLKKQIEEKWTVRIGDSHMVWETFEVQKAKLDHEAKLKMYTQEEYKIHLMAILEDCNNFFSFYGLLANVNPLTATLLETPPLDNIFLINDSGTKLYPIKVKCIPMPPIIDETFIYYLAAIFIKFPRTDKIIDESTKFIRLVVVTNNDNERYVFEWNFTK